MSITLEGQDSKIEEIRYKEGEGILGNLEYHKQERLKSYKARGLETNENGDFILTIKNFDIIVKELTRGR